MQNDPEAHTQLHTHMTAISPNLSQSTRRIYWLLQIAAHLLTPVVFLGLIWRSRKEPAHLSGLTERFGLGQNGAQGAVWFFTASVGEIRAASPLVKRFRNSGHKVLLTYQSPAGKAEGKRLFPDDPGITHKYVPVDLFWAIRLFLRRARPAMLIVLEIEIWPAMLLESFRAGLPLIMANGNLLDRSINKPGLLQRHQLVLYRLFSAIFTRTAAYKQRYIDIGFEHEKVHVVGDMKYDQSNEVFQIELGQRLRRGWSGISKVLLIASSVEGEEQHLLPMVQSLLKNDPALGVIWAPRSPQRFDAVANACRKIGFPPQRRSHHQDPGIWDMSGTRIVLGDSIGEMDIWYSMADLVFVGASLVDHGGHNIMEPLAHGRPVLMGPSIYGIAFAAEEAAKVGAFESHPTIDALENRIRTLLSARENLERMATNAKNFAVKQMGAADRTFASIKDIPGTQKRKSAIVELERTDAQSRVGAAKG